jgi:hypothetical protein
VADEIFDLFGNPVRPGKGQRGRPPYEATEKDRNKVKLLLALGWSNTRVAAAIPVSEATLKRYFRAELKERDQMRDRLDARRFEIVMEQANAGNVGALKELTKMLERSDLMRAGQRMEKPAGGQAKTKVERLGKKEQAQLDAEAAGAGDDDEWGSDLQFPGMVN